MANKWGCSSRSEDPARRSCGPRSVGALALDPKQLVAPPQDEVDLRTLVSSPEEDLIVGSDWSTCSTANPSQDAATFASSGGGGGDSYDSSKSGTRGTGGGGGWSYSVFDWDSDDGAMPDLQGNTFTAGAAGNGATYGGSDGLAGERNF